MIFIFYSYKVFMPVINVRYGCYTPFPKIFPLIPSIVYQKEMLSSHSMYLKVYFKSIPQTNKIKPSLIIFTILISSQHGVAVQIKRAHVSKKIDFDIDFFDQNKRAGWSNKSISRSRFFWTGMSF